MLEFFLASEFAVDLSKDRIAMGAIQVGIFRGDVQELLLLDHLVLNS